MATIEQLTKQLIDVNKDQVVVNEENVDAIDNLTKSVNKLLKFQKDQSKKSGADLEAQREARARRAAGAGPATSGSGAGSVGDAAGGSMGGIGSMLGGVAAWAGKFLLKFTKIFGMLKRMFMFGARATGIGAVIYLIYQTFKDIGENKNFQEAIVKIKESWNSIKTSFISIKDKIVGFFVDENGEKTDLTKTIEDTINSITEFLVKPLNRIKCTIQDFVSVTLSTVVKSIETIFEGLDLILSGEFGAGMNELFKAALGWDFEAGKMTTESMGLLWLLKNSYDAVLSLMPDLEVVRGSMSKSFDESIILVKDAFKGFSEFFTIDIPLWFSSRKLDFDLWLGDVRIAFTEKWEAFSGFFTETIPGWFETTKDKFVTAWDTGKDLLKTKWDEVVKFFTVDVPKYFTDWLTTAVDNVAAPIAATWARVVDWFLRVNTDITTKYEEIKAFGSNIISGVKDTWCNVVEFFTVDVPAKMKETWESIKAFGVNLLGTEETGLKMYWNFLVEFLTVDIPAKMKETWETIKAGGTNILDNISAKWESLKCFFTDTIPNKIGDFTDKFTNFDPVELITTKFEAVEKFFTDTIPNKIGDFTDKFTNFDPIGSITTKFEDVKCFFTQTIPNKIAEFDPLKDFDLIGSLTNSISELLDSIVSIIPSGEAIKKMLINAAKLIPQGEKILKLAGLIPDPEAEAAAAAATEAAMNLPAELSGASMDGTKLGTRSLTLANLEKAKLERQYGMSPYLARQEKTNPDLVRRLAKELNPVIVKREEDINDALRRAVAEAAFQARQQARIDREMARTVQEGAMYTTNNYVAASQGSTDTELSWVERLFGK